MKPYYTPVRINVPQEIDYTFEDQNGVPIPLPNYVTVYLLVKCEGFAAHVDQPATFVNKVTSSTVKATYTFTEVGSTSVQFYCVDADGKDLYGEPLNFRAVKNLNDLVIKDRTLKY
jgi:hypothetical protein